MKFLTAILSLVFMIAGIFAQQTNPPAKRAAKPTQVTKRAATPKPASSKTAATKPLPKTTPKVSGVVEKDEYDKALAIVDASEKTAALRAFVEKFPASKKRAEVLETIANLRFASAQEKLKSGETGEAVELLKVAVSELPVPIAEPFFTSTVSKIPGQLFWNGQRAEALELASAIEAKIDRNPNQFLSLASFYLSIENGYDASRLVEKAIELDGRSPLAYQTKGLAARLNFDLGASEQAYTTALELEPDSIQSLRSLADLKRARGKADEAIELYRRILEKDTGSVPAKTGLALALLDAGKREEAEALIAKDLEQNPNNVILLAGSAYWYSAHGDPQKAAETARAAIDKDPRFIWSHIALARALLAQKQPAAAEEVLLKARQYGNFPTLEYELASARLMSGFFRDAVEELRKSFVVKDGVIHTRLGGRVDHEAADFIDLLADERRASIFEPTSSDDAATAASLKSLLEFDLALNSESPSEDIAASLADRFIAGDDPMKIHRQLFAASALLGKRIAFAKVLDLATSVVDKTDDSFEVPDPGAAIMASELYESRSLALTRNELIKVPNVPRNTLSAIMRGRIEELAGWSLYFQDRHGEAITRLRRAASVMPPKSAWWRSSMWKLGAALQADGKEEEALDTYIKSYSIDKPDGVRYLTIESLYRKLKGNLDGLEAKIGANPQPISTPLPEPSKTDASIDTNANASATPNSSRQDDKSVITAEPGATPTTEPVATPSPLNDVPPASTPEPVVTPSPETTPTPLPTPDTTPSPEPVSTPLPTPDPTPSPEATPTPLPTPDATPSPETTSTPLPTPVATPSPTPEATATPEPIATPQLATSDATSSNDALTNLAKRPDPKLTASSESKEKPLFDPVIISVPNHSKDPSKPSEKKPTAPSGNSNDLPAGERRARIVEGKEITAAEIPPCTVNVSQDAISILRDGGSLGILVAIDGLSDLKALVATSESPTDVQVSLEPEIAGVNGQALFVIRSLTARTGDLKVRFAAPCGFKDVVVTVR